MEPWPVVMSWAKVLSCNSRQGFVFMKERPEEALIDAA